MSEDVDVVLSWDGDPGGELQDPGAAELVLRIDALDGRRRTLVAVRRGDVELVLGGSAAEGLVVYADLGDGSFWTARSPNSGSTDLVRVVAGGQPGDHEARLVTTLEVAVTAATTFLFTGGLDERIGWERS